MEEFDEITRCLEQKTCNMSDKLIWGHGVDETLGDQVQVTVIATGFHEHANEPVKKINDNHSKDQEISVKTKEEEDDVPQRTVVKEEPKEPERIRIPLNGGEDNGYTQRMSPSMDRTSPAHTAPAYDNNMLRKMSDTEISDYLSKPAYQRISHTTDSQECSSIRVNESGMHQDGAAYLHQKSGID